ncbi:orotidine-5'-phosphate decarboxylase [Candidatus Pacearchaeota archaeon]|nr:orotidine-5'-phosphate decarboxylase [Candidatus Pacearchaeota archaeon]MBD3283460.1 orotidine-5'-phosphate decarboxylase [Candidatus Pacearchaeota archaeon]
MTQSLADRLMDAIDEKQNPSVVGLDPRFENIPYHLKTGDSQRQQANAFRRFNEAIIDAIEDIVPAVKPQAAFYEQLGSEGYRVLEDTIEYAHSKGLIVITDAKRNDIGSTAQAYANGHLGDSAYAADALTVNYYLGDDGVKPFIDVCNKLGRGIFLLDKTSNKGSGQFQDQSVLIDDDIIEELRRLGIRPNNQIPLYSLVALNINRLAQKHIGERGYSPIGAVIGATYPEQAEILRTIMPNSFILVPGYGAQGGGANDAMPCFNQDGYGAIVNSSRRIIFAYQKIKTRPEEDSPRKFMPQQFAEAARHAALAMKDDLSGALTKTDKLPSSWRNTA